MDGELFLMKNENVSMKSWHTNRDLQNEKGPAWSRRMFPGEGIAYEKA